LLSGKALPMQNVSMHFAGITIVVKSLSQRYVTLPINITRSPTIQHGDHIVRKYLY
jgi:hypothetical protein